MSLRRIRLAFLTAFMIATATAAAAQGDRSVDELKAPPAPAFVVLGIAPTKVERPQSVRPLVMSLVSASKDTGFPRNYAVELAPYWMGTPRLSFDDYYRATPANLWRQLSVSVATTTIGSAADPGTAIGVGFRTLPLPGRAHPQLAAFRARLEKSDMTLVDQLSMFNERQRLIALLQAARSAADNSLNAELRTRFKTIIDEDAKFEVRQRVLGIEIGEETDPARLKKLNAELQEVRKSRAALGTQLLDAIAKSPVADLLAGSAISGQLHDLLSGAANKTIQQLDAQSRATALQIQELDRQRVGVMLAVAGAMSWQIPGNDVEALGRGRSSLWFTPGYRFLVCDASSTADDACTASVEVLGVARFLDDPAENGGRQRWETGARVVWQPIRPLAASLEWLGRTNAEEDDAGSRLVGVVEYQINDTAFLYASFGRDFAEPGSGRRTLVSTVGLTLGFGKQPIISPPIER